MFNLFSLQNGLLYRISADITGNHTLLSSSKRKLWTWFLDLTNKMEFRWESSEKSAFTALLAFVKPCTDWRIYLNQRIPENWGACSKIKSFPVNRHVDLLSSEILFPFSTHIYQNFCKNFIKKHKNFIKFR